MKLRILFFLLLTAIANYGKAQIITTIAGNVYVGDGGLATAAAFRSVWNVGTDAAGNVYVADGGHHRIRKIDVVTGIVTTIAGTGIGGYSGDGGQATKASLNYSNNVFIAPSGNIYISDEGNNRIRKVDPNTGIISTVAGTGVLGNTGDGGLAIVAQIAPFRICVDSNENIYFIDVDFYVIRKIDGATGIISTIAGTGTQSPGGPSGDGGPAILATIAAPYGICVDASKNIYVADFLLFRVRKIDAATGIINTIAGGGISTSDGILATQSILRGSVRSVSVDTANNIYIGTKSNCRKIDAVTGIISTVIGVGSSSLTGFSGDGGLATAAKTNASGGEFVDRLGNIYVADHINYRVRKVDVSTGIINTIGGNGIGGMFTGDGGFSANASLNYPSSVCVDKFSNLIVADYGNNRIRKINASTGIISTIAGNGAAGSPADGTMATAASVQVDKVKTDSSGNIYFSGNDGKIRKIDIISGIITTVAGGGNSTLDGVSAIEAAISLGDFCFDKLDNLYIADLSSYRIKKVNSTTGIITTIAGTIQATGTYSGDEGPATEATFGSTVAVCADDSNNIYIGDINFGVVRKINAVTGIITTVAGNGTLANIPAGDGGPATTASLTDPSILFADNSGNLFIKDKYAIRKVARSTGTITTIVGNNTEGFSGDGGDPVAAQINNSGRFTLNKTGTNLFITDWWNDRIRKVSFNTTSLCPPSGNKAITSDINGSSYQWQINNGTGFANITDNANYTGSSTGTVQLNNIPSSWAGYELRCLVDGNYSEPFTLKFVEQWTGAVNTAWENVGNWSCTGLPDAIPMW